jgi:hypothetical protein
MCLTAFSLRYEPENHQLLWKVKRFPGGAEYSFSAEVELSARIDDKKTWNRPPISMDFQVRAPAHAVAWCLAAVLLPNARPLCLGRFRSLSQRALAGSNVHGQWPASALLEDHREEQLSDGAWRAHLRADPLLRRSSG